MNILRHIRPALFLVCCLSVGSVEAQQWQSAVAFNGPDGKLEYPFDRELNRIPDFSHAGYRGGGVSIPYVPVARTIGPVEGDNFSHIQSAIEEIEAMELVDGVRGALLLEPGLYEVGSGPLRIRESGVLLIGSGSGENPAVDTIIRRTGTSTDDVILVGRLNSDIRRTAGAGHAILNEIVPVGSRVVDVADPSGFDVGDTIVIERPATAAWLESVNFGDTGDDDPWEVGQESAYYVREITRIDRSSIHFDAPVFDHLVSALGPSMVFERVSEGIIRESGVAHLAVEIETLGPTSEEHAKIAIRLSGTEDSWVLGTRTTHFVVAGVAIQNSRHVTVQENEALEPHSLVEGSRRYNFEALRSQLILFTRNRATEARHAYIGNGTSRDNGIVFHRNVSERASNSSEGHRRWGQGFLFDNHTEIDSEAGRRRIHLGNRGSFGTGHGWALTHSVAWNSKMNGAGVVAEKPPGGQNYVIGGSGAFSGNGPFDVPSGYIQINSLPDLSPPSLYERQLEDRLGTATDAEDAVTALRHRVSAYPNPVVDAATIRYWLPESGRVTLHVTDVLGRHVITVDDGLRSSGESSMILDTSEWAPGAYFFRLQMADGETDTLMRGTLVKSSG